MMYYSSRKQACMFSQAQLFATPWTVAHQAPLSMGFSKQEHWSELPLPTLGDLPHPGIKPMLLISPALAGGFSATEPPGKSELKLREANSLVHSHQLISG